RGDLLLGSPELKGQVRNGSGDREHRLTVLEVPRLRYAEPRRNERSGALPDRVCERLRVPDIEHSLAPLRVRVLRGEEAARFGRHLGQEIVERLAGDAGVVRIPEGAE